MTAAEPLGAAPGSVLVMGAGHVGCYLGGRMQAAGVAVDFVGRPVVTSTLAGHGLRVTDLNGGDHRLAPATLRLHNKLSQDIRPSLVMLCVKRPALADALRELSAVLPEETPVLCWQNGLFPMVDAVRAAPLLHLLPAVIPFNVAQRAPGHYHQGTSGALAAQGSVRLSAWEPVFARAGLPLTLHVDMQPVQWGKLLLNLNNPVNALSGLPLRAQLLDATHRRRFADLMEEALLLLRQARIEPVRMTALSWDGLLRVLRLPTPLFRLLALRMLRIDKHARSSMADDLAAGRVTEIDALCGEVLRLAHSLGQSAPQNQAMAQAIGRVSVSTVAA